MDYERLNHSGFDSGPTGRGAFAGRGARTAYALRTAAYNRAKRTRKRGASSSRSMIIKLGVCAAACAAVLLVRVLEQEDALSVSAQRVTEDAQVEDTSQLGRLQFVELPGILEVFSGGKGKSLPMTYTHIQALEEGLLLKLETDAAQTAKAGEACTVKTVGEDPELGKCVSVTTKGDRELIYYGLETVCVEEGQGLGPGDDLGSVETALYIRLNVEGRPTSVTDYFDLTDSMK